MKYLLSVIIVFLFLSCEKDDPCEECQTFTTEYGNYILPKCIGENNDDLTEKQLEGIEAERCGR